MMEMRTVGIGDGRYASENISDEDKAMLREREHLARKLARAFAERGGYADESSSHMKRDALSAAQGTQMRALGCDPWDRARLAQAMMSRGEELGKSNAAAVLTMLGDDTLMLSQQWCCAWAHAAFPFVRMNDQKLVASLMSTSVRPEFAEHVMPPWHAWRIGIPSGLVSLDFADARATDEKDAVDRIAVMRSPRDGKWVILAEGGKTFTSIADVNTADLCEEVASEMNVFPEDAQLSLSEHDRRAMRLVCRLVLGVCVAFNRSQVTPKHRGAKCAANGYAPRRGVEPSIREYVFTRPVKFDATQCVREYLAGGGDGGGGKRGPVNVQIMVRGHWKRVAHGVGSAERKWVHIEPYWRGPEDAPIAVRPHVLTKKDDEPKE